MQIRQKRFLSSALLLFFLVGATGLLPDPGRGDNSETAYYNDTFESLNEFKWDRAQYVHNPDQLKNFKLGDLEIVDNRLLIKTRTGAFSKAGLSSRYVFRGDFDIQIDCQYRFKRALRGMDQSAVFAISNRPEDSDAWWVAMIRLEKSAKMRKPRMAFVSVKDRKGVARKYKDTDDFYGTLRFVREGKKLTSLFKREDSERWRTLGYTAHFTKEDVLVGFVLQNFSAKRRTIKATDAIEVFFDNFKINQAGEVVEDEI